MRLNEPLRCASEVCVWPQQIGRGKEGAAFHLSVATSLININEKMRRAFYLGTSEGCIPG
jgi:hypothetical protein